MFAVKAFLKALVPRRKGRPPTCFVYRVVDVSNYSLFPDESELHRCFLIVNVKKQTVLYWYFTRPDIQHVKQRLKQMAIEKRIREIARRGGLPKNTTLEEAIADPTLVVDPNTGRPFEHVVVQEPQNDSGQEPSLSKTLDSRKESTSELSLELSSEQQWL